MRDSLWKHAAEFPTSDDALTVGICISKESYIYTIKQRVLFFTESANSTQELAGILLLFTSPYSVFP